MQLKETLIHNLVVKDFKRILNLVFLNRLIACPVVVGCQCWMDQGNVYRVEAKPDVIGVEAKLKV